MVCDTGHWTLDPGPLFCPLFCLMWLGRFEWMNETLDGSQFEDRCIEFLCSFYLIFFFYICMKLYIKMYWYVSLFDFLFLHLHEIIHQMYWYVSQLLRRYGMWDFLTLTLTCWRRFHRQACHVGYTKTMGSEPALIPCNKPYTHLKT